MTDITWTEKDLGPVDAYALAVAGGYTGTKEQWIEEIANASTNASNTEAYAKGTRGGQAVTSDDPAYHNNAEWFKDLAQAAKTEAQTAAASASAAYGTALLAPNYSTESTYKVGDHVIYNGNYYVCNTEISTAESWTAAHWTQKVIGNELQEQKSAFDTFTQLPSTYNWIAGYVRQNGTTTSSTVCQMALIKLKRNQTVTVGTRAASSGIISSTTQESISVGDTFAPVIGSSSSDTFTTFTYTALYDQNIVVCVRAAEYSISVTNPTVLDIEDSIKKAAKSSVNKYEFANDAVVNADVNWQIGYMGTDGVTDMNHKRGIWSNMLTYQQLKNVVIDSTMKVRYAFYDASGTFVRMWYGSPAAETFVKGRAFVVPTRTDGNSDATDAEIQTALSTTIVITRDELQSAFARTSEISGKVDKNGSDQIKPGNIDGSEYVATTITETIATDSYWYATGSGTIASGGAMSGMDKAVFDISEMTGKIAFGFDSEASYGTGSFVMGISSATESPYTRLTYFSSTGIPSSDYFEVDGNVAVLDLDALKTDYSTAVTLFVNIPHSKWLLENRVYEKKALHWLLISGAVPAIVVSKDGTGDYTTISGAVSHANNGDTIYIKDGEYKETVIVNKYIHLVGQSKQGTILYNDAGDYDNAPLLITQGSVCNMTIKSLAPADTSSLEDYAYAIHLDKHFATLAKYQKCEIYNCDIYSEVNDAIGAGTNYATEYDVHDCFLHVAHNPVKAGACGFKCHNGTNQTTGKVRLRNNIIITEDANGTSCYDILFHNGGISNIQQIELIQVGNVLKYYANGITSIFVPSGYNYGNSVAAMNTLS